MARSSSDLLHEALELPLEDRAKIAADLLDSLHDREADVDAAWAEEIRQRVTAARSGELESTDWRMVLNRVEKDVLGR
jgi:hypothetical protein